MASCSYIPRNLRGEEYTGFRTYRKELGYETAKEVFMQALSPEFQEDFKDMLELDAQGVPTYESAMKVPYVKNLIGNVRLQGAEQKMYPLVEDTRENYDRLVLSAHSYNTSSDNRDRFTAVVSASGAGRIRVEIRERTPENMEEYRNQYSTMLLNQRLVGMLGDLGLTVDLLEDNEQTNGRVDFSKAASIADGFKGLISIANGMQGELALSEEFSHLIIGMFRDTPLIQRTLNLLAGNDALIREILGDEYQANVDWYSSNPNHDVAGNEVPLDETLAEEALGKVLQEKLKTTTTTSSDSLGALGNLVKRLMTWLKGMFRGRDADLIAKAKNEVETTMGELAKDVLAGTLKLSKDNLEKNRRDARFNHLKEGVDKVLQLLRNADEIERKRSKITRNEKKVKEAKRRILALEATMTDTGKMEGLMTYAKWALSDLQDAMEGLDLSGSLEKGDFTRLRHIKSVLDSYSGFINDFHEVLDDLGEDYVVTIKGEDVNLRELWMEIDDLYKSCDSAFRKQAFAAFSDFLAPIYEKSPLRNEDGSVKTIQEVLTEEEFDISEFDRWLASMGNASSVLLQLFDKAVKNAKDKVRLRTMHDIRDIWKLRDNAEKRGITDFEWMYEKDSDGHKTGNYLSQFNEGQFRKDEEEMKKGIVEKYGRHPVGEDFKKAVAEMRAWYEAHSYVDMLGNHFPNQSYRNPAYERLTTAQKDTLEEILAYKASLERLLPADRRSRNRAIQRRRSGSQRLFDLASNPAQAFESVKDDLKSAFRSSEDDDIMYGERTKGLTDFTGQEYLTLPVLYTGRLKNPDTLSTDIFGDLMAYAYMARTYDGISDIYDPLEIGVNVVSQKEFVKNAGSRMKEEVLNVMGRVSKRSVKVGPNTSFAKKLRDYLECQVYGKYLKEDDVLGKDSQKTLAVFQKMTSMAFLGCNYLSGMTNVLTAMHMQNIEAAAGEFFSVRSLAEADAEYGKMIPEFIAELTDRVKQSKLALFDELFDVRQNAKDKLHNVQMKSVLRRLFGNNWLFVQQGMGDHWIYNRTAIAMAKKEKVKVNGVEMSVWDALEIATDDNNGYKYMKMKEGTRNLDGSPFSVGEFSRKIAHINHTLVGIYNDEDMNAAQRTAVGRLALQMRQWIVPQMMRRFQSKRMNLDIGKEEEGYYRTLGRLAVDMWKADFKIKAEFDKLSDSEKANIRRALTEIAQTTAYWILCSVIGRGIKDPDRIWGLKLAEYLVNKELHELGFLTPSPFMVTEGLKTIQTPFVAASAANKIAQCIQTLSNPFNWTDDESNYIKSGRYEGHSYVYKRVAELPLPPFTQLRQIDRLIEDLDESTKYYSKDYK